MKKQIEHDLYKDRPLTLIHGNQSEGLEIELQLFVDSSVKDLHLLPPCQNLSDFCKLNQNHCPTICEERNGNTTKRLPVPTKSNPGATDVTFRARKLKHCVYPSARLTKNFVENFVKKTSSPEEKRQLKTKFLRVQICLKIIHTVYLFLL